MKRILSLAILGLTMTASVMTTNAAEKRYYFVLGGHETLEPNYVDCRVDDVQRVLYVWENTLLGATATGPSATGESAYTYLQVNNPEWWGMGYVVGPLTGDPLAEVDLTDVDESWTLHMAFKTDCASNFKVILYGSTLDPDDPYVTKNTSGEYEFTKTNFPTSKRDNENWFSVDIPMSTMFNQMGQVGGPLTFKGPLKNAQNMITFSGGKDMGAYFGLDNVYLTNNGGQSVNYTDQDQVSVVYANGQLQVTNATEKVEVYNACGACVCSSTESAIDLSSLSNGIYVAKSGNTVVKFVK